MATTITNRAASKKAGMSLADMQRFVDDCFRAGLPTDAPVRAVVGIRGQVQELRAEAKKGDGR